MARLRSREAETEDVNQRRLQRGAVKRTHLTRWAIGSDEIAPGVIGDTHLHPSTHEVIREVSGASSAQLLVMSATADSIASGGDYVTFGAIVAVQGFDGVAAGASWVHPIEGVYVLDYEHTWDTYEGGGTIAIELDGTVPAEGVIGDGAAGAEGRGTIMYHALGGSVGKLKVTQSSGSAKTCDAVVRVAITDPLSTTVDEWTQVFTGDVWELAWDGTNWWTTEGDTGVTVSKRDTAYAEVSSFEASALALFVRGVTWDGTHVWVAGNGTTETGEMVARYTTAGVLATSWSTGPNTDGNAGLAWDGTHLWLVMSAAGVSQAERYTTAGVLDTSFALPGTPGDHQGVAYFENNLYVVDTTNSLLRIFQPDGTALGTIDLSGAVTSPTGVWIATDGTLYVSKDGDGIYQRTEKLAAI